MKDRKKLIYGFEFSEDKLSVSLLHQNIGNHGKSWLWSLVSLAPISMRRRLREYLPWGFKICAF